MYFILTLLYVDDMIIIGDNLNHIYICQIVFNKASRWRILVIFTNFLVLGMLMAYMTTYCLSRSILLILLLNHASLMSELLQLPLSFIRSSITRRWLGLSYHLSFKYHMSYMSVNLLSLLAWHTILQFFRFSNTCVAFYHVLSCCPPPLLFNCVLTLVLIGLEKSLIATLLLDICVFLGDCLISWCAKKQDIVSCSTTEAEYRAMADTTWELVWLRRLLHDMSLHFCPHSFTHPRSFTL